MSNENDLRTRLVPAVCTQCGAALEVDPTQEAAVCKYCNTPFIVDKAIQNYNIQQAKIEHVDNVTIDMKGTADSFFGFLGKQMSESREVRHEERRAWREQSHQESMAFMKIFMYMMIGMFALAAIWFVIMQIKGDNGADVPESEPTAIVETMPESAADNSTGGSLSFEFHTGTGN